MKCAFFIFNDNLLTLSHTAMIANSLLTPSWRLMALVPIENRLVSSANKTGSVLIFNYIMISDKIHAQSSFVRNCTVYRVFERFRKKIARLGPFGCCLPWPSNQMHKIACCACAGNARNGFPAAEFKGNRFLAIPAWITARTCRTCRDTCWDR